MKVTKQYIRSLIRESLEEMSAGIPDPKDDPYSDDYDDMNPITDILTIADDLDKAVKNYAARHPNDYNTQQLVKIANKLRMIANAASDED